ncbi:MAG: AI-2E family transporter [Bacilli bacterium]|nr:AI-2E family transporter [Bacilli bacterium]
MRRFLLKRWFFIIIGLIVFFLVVKAFMPYLKPFFSFSWRIAFPFLAAILISYLLYPLLNKLTDALNMHRSSAIVVIFLSFFGTGSFLIYKSFPVFFRELQEFSAQIPELIEMYEAIIFSVYESTSYLPEGVQQQIDRIIDEIELTLEHYIQQIIDSFVHSFDYMVSFIMIPILVFYLLKDFPKIKDYCLTFLPKKHKTTFERILFAIHEAFATYIRGQLILSFFIFLLTFLLYNFIDLNYAFLLSMFSGIMNIIPYFGPIIGTTPAVVVAMATSWNSVIYVIIIGIIVQIAEGTLLSPYIMGKTAKLHPIAIIFILLVSSELGGIAAMIISIPLVMIIRSVYQKLSEEKQQCVDN